MKSSGVPLSKLPARYQEQVAAQLCEAYRNPGVLYGNYAAAGLPGSQKTRVAPLSRYPFTVWINYRVPSLNRILGKRWAPVREKKVAKDALALALHSWPDQPAGKRLHVLVTLYRCRLIDPDNAFVKPLIDQMRYAKLLRDDDNDAIALTLQQVRVKKKHAEGTKVTLTEMLP